MPLVTGIETAAGVPLHIVYDQDGSVTPESDPSLTPKVQRYEHFDHATEELGHTQRYNCWGFTFLPRRYWIGSAQDVDQILSDNCSPVAPGALRPGDVIRYRDERGVTTHTGRVWQVDATGNCVKVRSKWGSMAEYVHDPLDSYITPSYGTDLAYFRQHSPLRGVGDLWLRDAIDDPGEQYSRSLWASPDILVDAPPYGTFDGNPVFGVANRVVTEVHNRSNVDIASVRVRYYWADPHAGFAPSNWQLIPGTLSQPNPTNPFVVPAGSSVQAPYVEWTPVPVPDVADPAHQCLLAIAFVNDDPRDSTNPNPLVYPFDIRWDNNIAARNVHVLTLKRGTKAKLQIAFGIPIDHVRRLEADLVVGLSCLARPPLFTFPPTVVPPSIRVTVGGGRPLTVTTGGAAVGLAALAGARRRRTGVEPALGPRIPMLARRIAPRAIERPVASRNVPQIPLVAKKPVPLVVEVAAPESARPGERFQLRLQQAVRGQVTGCYTVSIAIE
jgi:hypothetical protein